MRLENAIISQWEPKCNSCGSFAVELTIRADMVRDGSYSTFCNPDVRRDFENYISQYKYGDGANRDRTETELTKENEELKDKVKDLELLFGSELKISKKLRENVNALCDGQSELIKANGELKDKVKDLEEGIKANRIERYKLEKDLEDIADMLQVGALRTITDILDKAHYWVHEHSKDLSGKLDAFCRFRDDIMTALEVDDDATIDDVLLQISRSVRVARKTEFICGYFDVKQIPLTSIAENLCLEIKEKVISEYKAEVESTRRDVIREAAKKAGSLGNGVYLDGLTIEQNLRAENVRLKAENEKHKKYIAELEGSLDCIHCESAAALGYECE